MSTHSTSQKQTARRIINIYVSGIWAGQGTLDQHGAIDCTAILGGSQDACLPIYEAIEAAIGRGELNSSLVISDTTYAWAVEPVTASEDADADMPDYDNLPHLLFRVSPCSLDRFRATTLDDAAIDELTPDYYVCRDRAAGEAIARRYGWQVTIDHDDEAHDDAFACAAGCKYDTDALLCRSWIVPLGADVDAETIDDTYNAFSYFDADGRYKGPDADGVEPVFCWDTANADTETHPSPLSIAITPPAGTTGLACEPWSRGEIYAVAADWANASAPVLAWGDDAWYATGDQVAKFRHDGHAALADLIRYAASVDQSNPNPVGSRDIEDAVASAVRI